MGDNNRRKLNTYRLRIHKEREISEEAIQARMRWDMPILSSNHKCLVSLDLPVVNCRPSRACAEVCYASQGKQMYRPAVVKSLAVDRMIREDPERAARKMVDEAAGRAIRLAGSGDMLPEYKTLVDYIDRFGGSWWGFTRRVDTHEAMPKLMFCHSVPTFPFRIPYSMKDEIFSREVPVIPC